ATRRLWEAMEAICIAKLRCPWSSTMRPTPTVGSEARADEGTKVTWTVPSGVTVPINVRGDGRERGARVGTSSPTVSKRTAATPQKYPSRYPVICQTVWSTSQRRLFCEASNLSAGSHLSVTYQYVSR